MILLMTAVVVMTFASTSALIYLVFDRELQKNSKGCDGTFFCRECNNAIGYRHNGNEFIIGEFIEKNNNSSLPDNVISFYRHIDIKE